MKKLSCLNLQDQVFLLFKEEPGLIALTLHYAALWEAKRGKVCLFILSKNFSLAKKLAKTICPSTKIISIERPFTQFLRKNYSKALERKQTFLKLYHYLYSLRPNAIFLQENWNPIGKSLTSYQPYFDHNYKYMKSKSKKFLEAYILFNQHRYFKKQFWNDYNKLQLESGPIPLSSKLKTRYQVLKNHLEISRPYTILNLSIDKDNLDHRSITDPEALNETINYIIGQGYDVLVFDEMNDQAFGNQTHLIYYQKNPIKHIEDSLCLIAHSSAILSTKSDLEHFAIPYQIPLLGLNYVEPAIMLHHHKYRFAFKKVWDKKLKSYHSWNTFLKHPGFFDYFQKSFTKELEYHELSASEVLDSVKEFFLLISRPKKDWDTPSPLQRKFKALLDKGNIDLLTCQGLPTESSLRTFHQ